MPQDHPTKLRIAHQNGVATLTIDNPPVNVLDVQLMGEIRAFLTSVRDDAGTRVIVFESANPEIFIAHVDLTLVEQPGALEQLQRDAPEALNPFQAFGELLRAQPQVTIVKLAGLARGGGAEFIAAADMAFAAESRTRLAQCEALMGITPGGGGTQYLGERMTRGRALEVILGADLFSAKLAEHYGWINRALPDDELDRFVETLARNIAALPEGVVAGAKASVLVADHADGFRRETGAWMNLISQPITGQLIREALRAGAQTLPGELNLEALLRSVLTQSSGTVPG